MKPETKIRQATTADRTRLWEFIEGVYGDEARYKVPERWNWEYRENPFLDGDGDRLPIFIAEIGERIVGQMCAIPVKLQIGSELHDAAWGADFMVLPECRGQGVGLDIVKALAEHYHIYLAISMSDGTRRIHERLGSFSIEPVSTAVRWVRLDPGTVRRYLIQHTRRLPLVNRMIDFACRWLLLDRIVPLLANPLLQLRKLAIRRSSEEIQSEIVEVDGFPEDIDELWRVPDDRFDVGVPRNRRFLNWRFEGDGQLRYHRFVARREGKLRGYVVLRQPDPLELNVGIVVDLFCRPDDPQTLDDLILHAMRFFEGDVAAIEFATSLEQYQRSLSRFGFRVIRRTAPTCVCGDPDLKRRLEALRSRWFLTKADQDWDQLHPA